MVGGPLTRRDLSWIDAESKSDHFMGDGSRMASASKRTLARPAIIAESSSLRSRLLAANGECRAHTVDYGGEISSQCCHIGLQRL